MFTYKRLNFLYFFADFFLFLHDLMRLLQRTENIYYLFFFDRIYCCLFVFYQIGKIYIYSTTIWIYINDICNTINEHNQRQNHYLLWMFRYLERSVSKSSYKTSSDLSLIMIFMLSLFECIRPSSSLSLEDIK